MADPIGATFTLNISQMKKAIQEANRLIKDNESNWLSSASAMGDWTKSEEGLSGRLSTLSRNISTQEKVIEDLTKAKEEAIRKYGAESKEVDYLNTQIIKTSKSLQSSRKEYDSVSRSLDAFGEETKDGGKESEKAAKKLDRLDDSARDLDGGFSIAKGAIAGFIANGLTAMVGAIGSAVSSLAGLTESTREYRTMLGTLSTMADQMGASGDHVIDKWMDVNAVLGDEQAAVEGINNILSAGYTASDELDAITRALEGAALQWKDTLKFEGLADSLQEWIGSGGASLTGNFAELLERLGYDLEEVTKQTEGMTDAQRRQWAISTLNAEGLGDVSDAYREGNKELIAYNKAQSDFLNAQSLLGEMMQPFVTTVKQSTADIIYSFVDMVNGVEGAGDQLLYQIGYLAGTIYKGVQSTIQTLMPLVKSLVPQIVAFITESLPVMLAQGVAMITSILDGITQNIPLVTAQISGMLQNIILMITENAPALLNAALELFGQIVIAIPQMLVDLSAALPQIIDSIMEGLFNGEQSVFDTALDVLMGIVEAIPPLVVELVNNLPAIIDSITTSLSEAIPKVFDGAIELLGQIVDALPDVIADLVAALPDIIVSLMTFFSENSGKILAGAVELLMNIVAAIPQVVVELGRRMPEIITAIKDGIVAGAKNIFKAGYDLIAGLVDGMFSFDIGGKLKSLGSEILGGIKNFFGIHSPSTVMAEEVGGPIVEGIAVGMEDEADGLAETGGEIAAKTVDGFTEGWQDAMEGNGRKVTKSTEDIVREAGSTAKKVAENVGTEVGTTIATTTAKAVDRQSKDYSGDISDALTGLFEGDFGSLADSAMSAIAKTSTVGSIFSGILSFAKNILTDEENEMEGTMEELATALVDGLMKAFNGIVDNLPSILKGAVEFMRSFALALIRAVPEIVRQIPKIISTMVSALISDGIPALFEVGAELVRGLIEGMFSINLWDVLKSVGNGIVNGFKKLFGIRSPSKVMADEIGRNLALGMAQGVTDNIRAVNEAVRGGVDTSFQVDGMKPRYVTVNQTNHYSQAHSRYEIYKSRRDTANAVKLAMQGV